MATKAEMSANGRYTEFDIKGMMAVSDIVRVTPGWQSERKITTPTRRSVGGYGRCPTGKPRSLGRTASRESGRYRYGVRGCHTSEPGK